MTCLAKLCDVSFNPNPWFKLRNLPLEPAAEVSTCDASTLDRGARRDLRRGDFAFPKPLSQARDEMFAILP
jgi:hypothetical protein